jgi:hypothetical protein
VDPLAFSKGVTFDATAEGGAAPACAANVRRAWDELLARGNGAGGSGHAGLGRRGGIGGSGGNGDADASGFASVKAPLRLCPSQRVTSWDDLYAVMFWLQVGPKGHSSPHRRMPHLNSIDEGPSCVGLCLRSIVRWIRSGGQSSPRIRVPFSSSNEASTCVG